MRLFIIGGKSGSGKGSLAQMIKDYYSEKNEITVITEYSKYIKMYAEEIIGWNGDLATKPRTFLQDLGEEVRTIIGEDFFINRLKEDLKVYQLHCDNVVISDARLIKEFTAMSTIPNTYTIHLLSHRGNTLNEKQKQHRTELELDNYSNFDYTLTNDTLDNLKKDIRKILEEIK